ncbi:glycosyltransferase [Terrabacter terrigena]|uniref:Glycosyltransferase n=1 Tax=Terrabacter terrigena TaxID=574718 RepID=A0ABW3N347_9MICO
MSEILVVTWDGGGNVPPALGISAELQARGHHVRFLGHRGQAAAFAEAGVPFEAFSRARRFSSDEPSGTSTLMGVFADRKMGQDVVDSLARQPADVVLVDCLLFGVMDALRRSGREYAVLEHSFDGYFRRAAHGPLGLLLRLRGCRPLSLLDAGHPVLAATLDELDAGAGPVEHTGPVLADPPSGATPPPAAPAVLLSLSTFAFRSLVPTWQRVLDAVDGLPARVVATTGPAVDPALLRIPAKVEHHRWLPHADVLPEVSLVVGHGGHATTMAALAHDRPLVILPLDPKTDQPFVGRAVRAAGAGRTLSRRSSAVDIRRAIEDLLGEGPHRQAAARLGAKIRATPGAALAADRIEALPSARPTG